MSHLDVIRAHLICAREGYAVHVICGGECTPSSPVAGKYWCEKCEADVAFGSVAEVTSAAEWYQRDVAWLLSLVDALKREADVAHDCGQSGVCALPPGCARHWEERNRELVRKLDAWRTSVESAFGAESDLARELGIDLESEET